MHARWVLVVAVLATVLIGAIGYAYRGETVSLEVDPDSLDIGKVWVHDDYRRKIVLVNRGREPAQVMKLRTSCLCIGVSRDRFVVPPGDSFEVALRLNLSASNNGRLDSAEWPFAIRLTPSIPRHRRVGWELKGVVQSPFVLSSGRFVFEPGSIVRIGAEHVISAASEDETAITLRCVHPVRELAACCDPAKMGTADLVRTGKTSSSGHTLRLVPSDDLKVGVHRFAVRVTGITPDGQEAAVRIPALVHVVDDLMFSPAVLHFGYVTVGPKSVSKMAAIRSRSNEPFAVESIECDTSLLRVALLNSDHSDEDMRLRVSLRTDQEGPQGSTVRIGVRYPERQTTVHRCFRVLCTATHNTRKRMTDMDSLPDPENLGP